MCVHTHVRVCVVCAVSHLQSCVCQPKEGEYQQARNELEVQEKKNAPCLFEYFRNIYQIIILTVSCHSIIRHILCTISVL